MVNKMNMRAWVAALRSEMFPQGKKRLARLDRHMGVWQYCCMGVACELAARATRVYVQVSGDAKCFDGTGTLMPPSVYNWLGLDDGPYDSPDDPRLLMPDSDGEPFPHALSFINDDLVLTFAQIADLLEAQYELLEDDDAGQ